MRVLVLGGNGMLGHQLVESWRRRHEVHFSVRGLPLPRAAGGATAHHGVDVRDEAAVERLVGEVAPDAVVNATGVVKQRAEAHDKIVAIETNSLVPHRIAAICARAQAYLVHVSTDCVFSGRRGMYREDDTPDPVDLYGQTKWLGELDGPAITLRTSMIGLERAHRSGLVEWFLAQRRSIKGYRKAVFSGLTTLELARVIERLLVRDVRLQGLYHVSSAPIDKLTLLTGLRDRLRLDVAIEPDDTLACDRSLDSSRFRAQLDYAPPSWDAMLDELADQIKERQP
jgi:dTDP-4-dehydrorhamnose reductase